MSFDVQSDSSLPRRREPFYLLLAILVVLVGLFSSGLDEEFAGENARPQSPFLLKPLRAMAYYYTRDTAEERFYKCFGQMAVGQQYDRQYLKKHRGDLGRYEEGMLGPAVVTKPTLPYRDYIAEYPPVNFPVIAAPSLMSPESSYYSTIFRLILGILSFGSVLMSAWLARRFLRIDTHVAGYLFLSLLATLLLGPILITRLDSIALFFFLLAIVSTSRNNPAISGLSLALSVGAKIVPIFLSPFFILHYWYSGRRKDAIKFAFTETATIIAIFLPPLLVGKTNLIALFKFHSERPVQVESTYAGILRIGELLFSLPVKLAHSQGSWNLVGDAASFLVSFSQPLALTSVASMLWVYRKWLLTNRDISDITRERWLLRACAATVAALMFFSKVLSPQYLIWVWPWIFLTDYSRKYFFTGICLLAFYLTQLITGPYATSMVYGYATGTLLLNLRNFSILGMFLYLARTPSSSETNETANKIPEWVNKSLFYLPLFIAVLAFSVRAWSVYVETFRVSQRPSPFQSPHYRIEFQPGLNDESLRVIRGMSHPEKDRKNNTFAWSQSKEISLLLPSATDENDYLLRLRIRHALTPAFLEGGELLANGHPVRLLVSEKPSTKDSWPREFYAIIPWSVLKPDRLNKILLKTPAPVSPSAIGKGKDTRELGLMIDWLSWTPIDGFACFGALSDEEILRPYLDANWNVRIAQDSRPPGSEWRQVVPGQWETLLTPDTALVPHSSTWIYRPGDFTADLPSLPVGPGWSEPLEVVGYRPARLLEGNGQIMLDVPAGSFTVNFTVLKSKPRTVSPDIELFLDDTAIRLQKSEAEWETSYEGTFDSSGGKLLQFKTKSYFTKPAVGTITISRKAPPTSL